MAGAARAKSLKQVGLAEMKDDLSRYLRLAEEEEIVITRHGKPAGVLIGFRSRRRTGSNTASPTTRASSPGWRPRGGACELRVACASRRWTPARTGRSSGASVHLSFCPRSPSPSRALLRSAWPNIRVAQSPSSLARCLRPAGSLLTPLAPDPRRYAHGALRIAFCAPARRSRKVAGHVNEPR